MTILLFYSKKDDYCRVVNIIEQAAMLINIKIIVKLYFYCPQSYHKLTGSCPVPVINFPSTHL